MSIKDLIPQLPEIYQPIIVNGEVLAKGNRDCEDRWEIIKPHLKPHGVVLELGSATGFFAQKIAHEYPDSLVISVESDPIMCEIQRQTLEEEGIYNVVVCQHRITADDLIKWSKHTEVFDTILCLSVLHHFPADKVKEAWDALLYLGTEVINEIPPLEETTAYGQEAIKEIYGFLPEGRWLGSTTSHLGHIRDIDLFEGGKRRENLDAFFGVPHPDRHRFTMEDGKIDGKNIIAGVNVWNLLHFNIVWPQKTWWQKQVLCAYDCVTGFKSDARPWNLIRTSQGVVAIDYKAKDVPEFNPDDTRKLHELFTKMKSLNWNEL